MKLTIIIEKDGSELVRTFVLPSDEMINKDWRATVEDMVDTIERAESV